MASRNLLLVSLGLGVLRDFVGGTPAGQTVAFIPTAADPCGDRSFVERDRTILREFGYTVRDVSLDGTTPDELRAALTACDFVFVAGGNSFYLLQKARESGLSHMLGELVAGGLKYVGASAGAILVGPDLRPVATLDDPADAPGLESFDGLGLVDFVVLPHYGIEKYLPEYEAILNHYQNELTLVPLRDDQAVLVTGTAHEVVDSARRPRPP
jgi:dipeptidase E